MLLGDVQFAKDGQRHDAEATTVRAGVPNRLKWVKSHSLRSAAVPDTQNRGQS